MATALFLIVLGVLTRLVPHPQNAVPLAAIALYAGARLPRRVALVVPIAILVLSDVVINLNLGQPLFSSWRLYDYGVFAALAALASVVRKDAGVPVRAGLSVLGSTVFFLVSNFVVWAEGTGMGFPHTAFGLWQTYVVAILFFGNSVLADLIGTAALFGLDGVIQRAVAKVQGVAIEAAPAVSETLS